MNTLEEIEKNIITCQQEQAFEEYKIDVENEELNLPFWEFYSLWCIENGCFNDRASYQSD